jgi:hypothetical protein
MKFSAEWHDPGVSASAELRATFCLLDIEVGGRCVSRFFDERYGRAYDRIAMPAYPPAQGLARCWWSLMAGRSGTVRLRRFRDGFALPDIRFEPDGRYIDVTVEPFEYANPQVGFPRRAAERVPVDVFERDIAEFIEAVVMKLGDGKVRNSWLEERWSRISASIEDDEERAFCEAAGALGVDPYGCDDAEAHSIEAASEYFDGNALAEFLAGQRGRQTAAALAWLAAAEEQVGERAVLPEVAVVAERIRGNSSISSVGTEPRPFDVGYRAAADCRYELSLPPERVFGEVDEIAALFGGRQFEAAGVRVPGLRAEACNGGGAPKIIVAGLPTPRSRTFAMMRAIGDYLVFGETGRAPITDTYSYRQAVGRAFAVEMLAPAEAILQMERDGMTSDEIAAARNVSEIAIAHHLENRRTPTF